MLKSTASAPTRRECFLLALLLLALLSVSRAGIGVLESRPLRLVPEKVVLKHDSNLESTSQDAQVPTTESERWRTRITWTPKQVPLTTVVSHAPGARPASQADLLPTPVFKAGRYLTTCFC